MSGRSWRNVTLVRKRAWLAYVAFAILLTGELANVLPIFFRHWLPAPLAFLPMAMSLPLLVAFRRWPEKVTGALAVGPDALTIDGQTIIRRNAIRQAVAFRDGETAVVRIRSRFAFTNLRFEQADDVEAFLASVGQSATQTTTTFPVSIGGRSKGTFLFGTALAISPMSLWVFYMLRIASTRQVHFISPLLPLLVAVLAFVGFGLSVQRKLVVGADGFTLKGVFGQRFVPFRDLGAVKTERGDVLLSIRDRKAPLRLTCATGARRLQGLDAEAPALAVARRIEEARALVGQGASVDARAFLDRGTRTRQEWQDAMDRFSDDAASFRSAAVPLDELWKVLEDPAERPSMRAGAALALRRQLDEPGRLRIRVAATTSAAPALKRVFTAIDQAGQAGQAQQMAEDEALQDALDALDSLDAKEAKAAKSSRR